MMVRGEALRGLWRAMLRRCYNANYSGYHKYGGRGITVCPEWMDFTRFAIDMGPRPAGKSLDRRDNDGPYTKGNCRWATATEQARNRRSSKYLTIDDETLTVAEWADRYHIHQDRVNARLRLGWSLHKALTTAVRHRRK